MRAVKPPDSVSSRSTTPPGSRPPASPPRLLSGFGRQGIWLDRTLGGLPMPQVVGIDKAREWGWNTRQGKVKRNVRQNIPMGVQDQRQVETRQDVLVYTSAPVAAPLEVTGPLVVKLFASSSAVDTDFTAKLVDVRPDGYAQNLADGILRTRYRASRMRPSFLTPNQVYDLTIDLWATSHVFLPEHRVRLEISSSNFPRFDRNLNTGEDQATSSRRQTAAQTIFHDSRYPSHVLLPVIPR